jgi:hypothetical protein
MMAGAVPVKTQQLLDKSLIQKSSARGLICGKGTKTVNGFEHQKIFKYIIVAVLLKNCVRGPIVIFMRGIFHILQMIDLSSPVNGNTPLPCIWLAGTCRRSYWPRRASERAC